MHLQVGQIAPDFNLPSTIKGTLSLKDFKEKNIILYFYPKDDTPGCTLEACGFRDVYDQIIAHNTVLLGVSKDSLSSHERFKDKYNLPFPLLSDEKGEVCQIYGVWGKKTLYGKIFEGIIRSTFLINTAGRIQRIWYNLKLPGHIADVLRTLS